MNANEIIDELNGRLDHKAANMIRNLQAEVEALKERNKFLESFYRTVMAQQK